MTAPSEETETVLDSHCHAWRRWPYPPLVPDEDARGTIDQLLYEMDLNGVERSVVVCAAIGDNLDNLEYVSFGKARHPDRLEVLADLDCTWSATYHAPGSPDRLRALADRHELVGFTHYVEDRNDGWLLGREADALFSLAAERQLVVSLAASPAWQTDLRTIARRHPSVPVLCHHLGGTHAGKEASGLGELLASAEVPNVLVKVSGFHYASARHFDYPWPDAVESFHRIFDAYGPHRLCWGSDFPASRRSCTYRQSLEVVRQHCPFLGAEDRRLVLGGTLRAVLATRHPLA